MTVCSVDIQKALTMTILSQTYSRDVAIEQLQDFFQRRGIRDKIQIEQKQQYWYIFRSDYFSEDQLHDILDDACDALLEVQE